MSGISTTSSTGSKSADDYDKLLEKFEKAIEVVNSEIKDLQEQVVAAENEISKVTTGD